MLLLSITLVMITLISHVVKRDSVRLNLRQVAIGILFVIVINRY